MTDRRQLIGQIDTPGTRPQNVRLTIQDEKQQFDTVTVITTAYTVADKTFILVDDDTAAGVVTITLPPVIGNTDREIYVKKLGTTATVTLDGNASETIDGVTTLDLTVQYESAHIVSDGAVWHVI